MLTLHTCLQLRVFLNADVAFNCVIKWYKFVELTVCDRHFLIVLQVSDPQKPLSMGLTLSELSLQVLSQNTFIYRKCHKVKQALLQFV